MTHANATAVVSVDGWNWKTHHKEPVHLDAYLASDDTVAVAARGGATYFMSRTHAREWATALLAVTAE